jgi:hypothetical protein
MLRSLIQFLLWPSQLKFFGSIFGSGSNSSQSQSSTSNTTNTTGFSQYFPQFAQQLASLAGGGTFGNATPSSINPGLTSALNGSSIGSQLMGLVSNPSSIYSTPQYQAAFNQGQSAVNSTLAAQGLNASGNQLAALQSYGQSFGQNAYNQQLSQLSGLYGQSLGANQQAFSQGQSAQQQAFQQLAALSGLNYTTGSSSTSTGTGSGSTTNNPSIMSDLGSVAGLADMLF